MALMSLLPKEEKFYVMLDELSKTATESCLTLCKLIESTDEDDLPNYGIQIEALKSKAKQQIATLNSEICKTFITPFDREDLQALGATLYLIPKIAEKIQKRMLTHNLKPFNKDFNQLSDIVKSQTAILDEIIFYLKKGRKMKEIDERVTQIHELEDKGDSILGQLIANSFYSIDDTRELILRKDIYEMLEDATDYYRDCANLALQIVLKHS